ncbi:sensor histidine kinase [Corynebacterium bovis]|uniref:histidine kinase n=1 Tax=Corynebacterium bovis TaxID=36808 RepID=A0A426Q447_9CORY|nr:histidine kinase [Corynebacterium bovis]RRO90680.1 histidine kinase [Corynebacterium bovis]RRQ01261.1 histidine kinase [Corynebacterium bovis]RRQ03446.1 histidine kinase [Corynebacterium bovis]RRQ04347.1 histidine kinase [Corynebacterium bovis]RRQ06250.1 histidine kinase [Corynebacterium bovis]
MTPANSPDPVSGSTPPSRPVAPRTSGPAVPSDARGVSAGPARQSSSARRILRYGALGDPDVPWWRDRGLWIQAVVQVPLFVMFGYTVNASMFELPVLVRSVAVVGYMIAFVGLLVQRRRPQLGLGTVALGLIPVLIGEPGNYVLAYGIVCREAWFIAAYIVQGRRWWLAALVTGSLAGVGLTVPAAYVFYRSWSTQDLSFLLMDSFSRNVAMLSVYGLLALVSIALFWQLGLRTRRRNEEVATLEARAELAAATERNRIAREMHDIVAHSLTAVIAQADGGRYIGRKDPEKAIAALESISSTGREALGQMRELLSVLREDGPRSADSVPGVDDVPLLVADACRSGADVSLESVGAARPVPVAVGLTVYRCVQEALTNVLKHAGPTRASVVLDWSTPSWLRVRVDNAPGEGLVTGQPALSDSAGQGLIGVAERARIHGGQARWGASSVYPGGWVVCVAVPVPKG